ncbi:hypothetical protein BLX24_27565 [Arsenicibacter rosenii]|uniref:Signal transduction histidine kinase internal region domain-containing protein n=2 Tax=Arsenicibacter rosenii TaxID=1750698 RepID=A0A1S2VB47_9BACT|nr:hypothetical protein BLX24_27565 [Arsenicibacter rosenii]
MILLLPLYIIFRRYTRTITTMDDEEAAITATLLSLSGVFSGRYLAMAWSGKRIPEWLIAVLILVLVGTAPLCANFAATLQRRLTFMHMLFLTVPAVLFCVAAGMLIKLIRDRVRYQLQEARAQAEHSRSELHLLQSQLSPHFLFNTLNNLYGISITQPDKTPPLLLKLSDLLRYTVYDAKELFVPLADEVAYINNYIDFESLRIGNKLNLTTAIEPVSDQSLRIAPMLLIVFIENAFKHARNTTGPHISIDITMKRWGNSVLLLVKNTYSPQEETGNDLNRRSGLGLANVRKRLQLLYPNAHDLSIQDEGGFYTVQLQVRIK